MDMSMIIEILKGTPVWVYGIFAYLLWVGINATKERKVFIPLLFIMPTVLNGLKLVKLLKISEATAWLYFGGFLLVGAVVGWLQAVYSRATINKKTMTVTMPGTWQTLILILLIFGLKYYFGYMEAENPEQYRALFMIDIAVSAAIIGRFYGRVLNYVYRLL